MSVRQALEEVLESLPDDRLSKILDFARFLNWQEERMHWQQFGQAQFARAYGPHEPEYTPADLKPEGKK